MRAMSEETKSDAIPVDQAQGEGGELFGAGAFVPAGLAEVDADEGGHGFSGGGFVLFGFFWFYFGLSGAFDGEAVAECGPAGGIGHEFSAAGGAAAGSAADVPGAAGVEDGHRVSVGRGIVSENAAIFDFLPTAIFDF